MKLKAMFSAVELEQFKPSTRHALIEIFELINQHIVDLVFPVTPQDTEFENFRHMFDCMDVGSLPALIRAKSPHKPQQSTLLNVLGELDVQAAWVLDGGDLVSYLSYLRSNDSRSLSEIAIAGRQAGLHNILFQIGYANSSLSLKGANALLRIAHNRDKGQEQAVEETQLEAMSLIGAYDYLSKHSEPLSGATKQYRAYFHSDSFSLNFNAATSPQDLVRAAIGDCRGLRNQWWTEVEFLLRVLIYNTGLQLKLAGWDTPSIIQGLSPVLEAVIDESLQRTGSQNSKQQVGFFRTQVWLNLFSPFPDALAELGAKPEDLLGHPGRDAVKWNRETLSTVEGPLVVFTSQYPRGVQACHALEGMQNCGIELDLDLVLQGTLKDWCELYSLIKFKGSSPLLEQAYAQVLEAGPELKLQDFLEPFTGYVDSDSLSDSARLGLWIVRFQEARRAFLKGAILHSDDSDCPAEYLTANPEHKALFFQYLIKNNQLEGWILRWCGYDSSVLDQLDGQANEHLRISMLEGDLGL
jgi:hypothetical protein